MQKRHGAYGPLPNQELLIRLDNIGSPKPEEFSEKPHFIFSIKNIIHVLKGIFSCPQHEVATDIIFMKLWYHEMTREFYDRNFIDKTLAQKLFCCCIISLFIQSIVREIINIYDAVAAKQIK